MAAEGAGLRRLQWVERATPSPRRSSRTGRLRPWARCRPRSGTTTSPCVRLLAPPPSTTTSTSALRWRPRAREQRPARRPPAKWPSSANTAGHRPAAEGPLPPGIAAVLRQWADPTADERLACWGDESIPTTQAGPSSRVVNYDTVRTDGYVHRVARSPPGPASTWAPSGCTRCWPQQCRDRSGRCRCTSRPSPLSGLCRGQGCPDHRGMAQRKRTRRG